MDVTTTAKTISVTQDIPRAEYPRPQFVRDAWQTLNGTWEFEFDDMDIGLAQKWFASNQPFSKEILVPYSFQSKLSGIGTNEFHDVVWYRRNVHLTASALEKRVLLHFGAVDYVANVWVNGILATSHEGGHTPFSVDITNWVTEGQNVITVRAEDPTKRMDQPRGKQYWEEKSASIFYTRTTGIWQPVWLEFVDITHISSVKFTPNVDTHEITMDFELANVRLSGEQPVQLDVLITFGSMVVQERFPVRSERVRRRMTLDLSAREAERYLWSPEHPNLFDVTLTLLREDNTVLDRVDTYFGLRKISIENGRVLLNNRPYYMRLVLDQGYFPDGILTPPTDEAIRRDVELTKSLGFNGARKHQKVEDPRYLYWCDKLGLLVWGEMANSYTYSEDAVRRIGQEWQEAIERDYNHPCIVVWVPLNESWGVPNLISSEQQRAHATSMYYMTKSLDPTRLVVSNDGWEHTISDLATIHDYESRKEVLKARYASAELAVNATPGNRLIFSPGHSYQGQPILVTEFGGISYKKSEWDGWGYSGANSDEDFIARYAAVVEAMYESPIVQGFCYTQLTDVEQEINGVLTYDRQPKVSMEIIRDINLGKHAK